jgi:hypothetical protein
MRKETLEHGDRVEIYRNLHNNTFSVRLLRPIFGRSDSRWSERGKIVRHIENFEILRLTNAKFAVQPAGRAKVIREKKKNVHAFIRGTVDMAGGYLGEDYPHNIYEVSYNPYKSDKFQKDLASPTFKAYKERFIPIYTAPRVSISHGKVYVT